jgi:hypothetical protein
MLIPGIVVIISGIEILKNREVKDYWPLVALSIAIFTCCVTPIQLDPANFRGLLGNMDGLTAAGPFQNTFFGAFASLGLRPHKDVPIKVLEE